MIYLQKHNYIQFRIKMFRIIAIFAGQIFFV